MCAISAVAPNLYVFTGAQMLQRGVVVTTATVAVIAVIEEAPEGARAYAALDARARRWTRVLALGRDVALRRHRWRRLAHPVRPRRARPSSFAPVLRRHLRETTRYTALAARSDIVRGRAARCLSIRTQPTLLAPRDRRVPDERVQCAVVVVHEQVPDRRPRSRTPTSLCSVRSQPRFRGSSACCSAVASPKRAAANRSPRSRSFVATATQMIFFLGAVRSLWVMSAVSIFMAGASGIALGTLDAELFPTEVRSTSNALSDCRRRHGSVTGLVARRRPLERARRARTFDRARRASAALVAVIFVFPLPESGADARRDQPDRRERRVPSRAMTRTPQSLLDGLAFPEGPRWHEDRLWFSDQHDSRVFAMDVDGKTETDPRGSAAAVRIGMAARRPHARRVDARPEGAAPRTERRCRDPRRSLGSRTRRMQRHGRRPTRPCIRREFRLRLYAGETAARHVCDRGRGRRLGARCRRGPRVPERFGNHSRRTNVARR